MSASVESSTRPAIAAGVTVLLWASAFVVIRDQGSVFSPGALAFWRLAFALVLLTPLWLLVRSRGGTRPVSRHALVLVAAYGAAWFGGYTVVLNWAEQHLDAGTAALLVNVAPLLVAVYAGIFLGEGFPRPVLVGIAVGFLGVVVITVGGGDAHADLLGIVLGLLTAVLYAVGVLLQKVALHTVDAVTATWLGAIAGLVVTLPFVPSASRMAATTLVVPAIVIVLSWLFLGEVPTLMRVIGGALCLLGVAISRGLVRVGART